MLNASEQSVIAAQKKAKRVSSSSQYVDPKVAASRALTAMMSHGGLYTLLDQQLMTGRLSVMVQQIPAMPGYHDSATSYSAAVGSLAESFFQHLVINPYTIHSSLMSHIAFPHEGTSYTEDSKGNPSTSESPDLPAVTTFIGQFIDHDLTMNAVELFLDQNGAVQNTASPLIDLDCIFGPRSLLNSTLDPNDPIKTDLYEDDGKTLRLKVRNSAHGECYIDLQRDCDFPETDARYKADGGGIISDKRNDENQMLLQVHLLLMRVHNRMVKDFPAMDRDELRIELIRTWQSMLLYEHLPRILQQDTLTFLLEELDKDKFGAFFYKPLFDLQSGQYVASLPHEFAIAYRFGHSQLRPSYQFRKDGPFYKLFDNTVPPKALGKTDDLRGGQILPEEHLIDWTFFATKDFRGNKIDEKVTSKVFDLPESAIPDDIKFIGNLIHRNLIRSTQVGLCSGEDLADAYMHHDCAAGVTTSKIMRLMAADIEPNEASRALFMQDANGNPTDVFRTPLWYYILREAALYATEAESKLGPLGSRLVGEVILGAIHWQDASVITAKKEGWTSKVLEKLGKPGVDVTFLDLAEYAGTQPGSC